jgi:fatty acid desaturase
MTEKKTKKATKSQSQKDAEALRKAFKELQVSEFVKYLQSPWRIMWHNFLAGVFRALGTIFGLTIVFGFLIWLLAGLVDFPLIGQYFSDLKEILESFSQVDQTPPAPDPEIVN